MNYKPQTQVNIYMVTFSVNFHHHWQSKLDKKIHNSLFDNNFWVEVKIASRGNYQPTIYESAKNRNVFCSDSYD